VDVEELDTTAYTRQPNITTRTESRAAKHNWWDWYAAT